MKRLTVFVLILAVLTLALTSCDAGQRLYADEVGQLIENVDRVSAATIQKDLAVKITIRTVEGDRDLETGATIRLKLMEDGSFYYSHREREAVYTGGMLYFTDGSSKVKAACDPAQAMKYVCDRLGGDFTREGTVEGIAAMGPTSATFDDIGYNITVNMTQDAVSAMLGGEVGENMKGTIKARVDKEYRLVSMTTRIEITRGEARSTATMETSVLGYGDAVEISAPEDAESYTTVRINDLMST